MVWREELLRAGKHRKRILKEKPSPLGRQVASELVVESAARCRREAKQGVVWEAELGEAQRKGREHGLQERKAGLG